MYLSLDQIAERAGLPVPALKVRMLEKHLMDPQEQPLGQALVTATTRYRFYHEKEGRLEGEWLWHRDILKELELEPPGSSFEWHTTERLS